MKRICTGASQPVVDAPMFFVFLFHFMNQVKFLPKSSPSAYLTRDRHTTLFSLILLQPKLVWRGDGEQKRKWIYQVAVHLKISLCFQEHTMQDKVVKTGRQRQAPSSLPFTWRGPYRAVRETKKLMKMSPMRCSVFIFIKKHISHF